MVDTSAPGVGEEVVENSLRKAHIGHMVQDGIQFSAGQPGKKVIATARTDRSARSPING